MPLKSVLFMIYLTNWHGEFASGEKNLPLRIKKWFGGRTRKRCFSCNSCLNRLSPMDIWVWKGLNLRTITKIWSYKSSCSKLHRTCHFPVVIQSWAFKNCITCKIRHQAVTSRPHLLNKSKAVQIVFLFLDRYNLLLFEDVM